MNGKAIQAILKVDFGVALSEAPSEAIEWAAMDILDNTGDKKFASSEFSWANRQREKLGKPICYSTVF